MKTKIVALLALLCAGGLAPRPCRAAAFTPSMTDTFAYSDKEDGLGDGGIITTETGTVKISIPLSGVDITGFDANTSVEVIVVDTNYVGFDFPHVLGDDPKYTPGKKSATFEELDPNYGNVIGKTTWTWTSNSLSISGSYSDTNDVFVADRAFGTTADEPTGTTVISDAFTDTVNFDVFTYTRNLPATGKNKSVEKTDANANVYILNTGSVTGAADYTPPKVTIAAKPASVTAANPVTTLSGKATDNVGVASIFVGINGGFSSLPAPEFDLSPAVTSTNWSEQVDLSHHGVPGTNIFSVYAMDTSSNYSSTNSVAVFWVLPETVMLQTNPPKGGTITGLKNNQTVDIGKGYPVTATAKTGYVFLSWTNGEGDLLSQSPSFDYDPTNPSDMTLVANFATNPYVAIKGTYNGLFYDPINGATPTNAGYITLTLTTTGAYSGKLYLGSSTSGYSFTGQFTLAPDFTQGDTTNTFGPIEVKRGALAPLVGTLQLNADTNLTDPGAGWIVGSINPTDDSWATNAIVEAELEHYNTNTAAVGVYNFSLPPLDDAGVTGPGGYSYGSATLTSKGAVTFGVNLADGLTPAFTFASTIGLDGRVPLYSSLYSGKGVILGWLVFTNDTTSMTPEVVNLESTYLGWAKLPTTSKFYGAGFSTVTNGVSLTGSMYVAPNKGTNIVGWTNGTMTASGANLTNDVNATLAYNPVKNTFTGTNTAFRGGKVSLTLTTASGALSGSFVPATGQKAISFKGLLLPNFRSGYGFFAGTNQTGAVLITPPSPPPTSALQPHRRSSPPAVLVPHPLHPPSANSTNSCCWLSVECRSLRHRKGLFTHLAR